MSTVKVKVKKVVEKVSKGGSGSASAGTEPILVRFEHGQLKPGVELNSQMSGCYFEGDVVIQSSTKPNARALTGPQTLKRKQVVVVQNDRMTYLGASDNALNSDDGELRTFIAIKRKRKLSLYEASPIVVSPFLGNFAHLQVKDKSDEAPKTLEERYAAAKNLVKAFGSKKKKLNLEKLEKNKIDMEQMNESINSASQSAKVAIEVQDNKDDSILALAPPCNRDTKYLNKVYLLDDILTKNDLDDMNELAEQWLFCTSEQIQKWKEAKRFSDYFFTMWRKLSPKKNERHSKHVAKLVLYTELLICLMKLKHPELRKKVLNVPTEFPNWLVEKALENFTTLNANNVRCRSEAYKDKTSCYIMVLVLLANEFVFDVQLMSTSLQIHIKKLLTLAKAVGITVKYNSASKEYTGLLKLPLPQPVEKRGKQRKLR